MSGPRHEAATARERGGGLYVHVPFCDAICRYCHFPRTARHDPQRRRRLVAALGRELALRSERCRVLREGRRPLRTVYVGGGTPSVLEPALVADLVAGAVRPLPTAGLAEFTVEANPESLDRDRAEAWRRAGADRVSLGVQSLDPAVLARLGRRCEPATARRALRLAAATFPRVSADWILGPGVRPDRLCRELDEAVGLGVEHVSLYILEVHAGTPLARDIATGRLRLPPDREVEAGYLAAVAHLERLGLPQYEVSNFARPGAESRHNRAYWRGVPYLALGPGAAGFWGRRRYVNEPHLGRYLERIARGEVPEAVVDPLDRAARRLEAAILPLRTREGLPLDRVPDGALDMARGERDGWWTVTDGRLRLSPRGFLRIDTVEERLARALSEVAI